jgi:hypothetical protein
VVDLLRGHHREGRRFAPTELVEEGAKIAVGLAVTDPRWEGTGQVYKVFTFDASGEAVLLEDCRDRDDALAKLATPPL